jgi:hypothetical protein
MRTGPNFVHEWCGLICIFYTSIWSDDSWLWAPGLILQMLIRFEQNAMGDVKLTEPDILSSMWRPMTLVLHDRVCFPHWTSRRKVVILGIIHAILRKKIQRKHRLKHSFHWPCVCTWGWQAILVCHTNMSRPTTRVLESLKVQPKLYQIENGP